MSCECEFGNLVLLQVCLIRACWCPDLLCGFVWRLQMICVMVGSCHMLVGAQICIPLSTLLPRSNHFLGNDVFEAQIVER